MTYEKPWYIEHEEMKKRKRREARGVTKEELTKRGKKSKRKGSKGGREAKAYLERTVGGTYLVQHGDPVATSGPLAGVMRVECKRNKRIAAERWVEQAERDAASAALPEAIVLWREDTELGIGKKMPPWRVCLDADKYFTDWNELRDLRTIVEALKLEERVREEGG